jgi:regulator of protease activity HflC (stomatin/prohibitin superfamily)
MQLQLVRAAGETRQLDEIVNAFTPPMRRVCPHLAEAALRDMIERMALQQLADERRRPTTVARRRTTRRAHPARFTTLQAC